MGIRRILKKILQNKAPDRGRIRQFSESGNLVVGKNCTFQEFSIFIQSPVKGKVNVIIGDNCWISGSIVLHSPDAQIIIGDDVFIGPRTTLFCYDKITISNSTMISWGCTLIDTNAHSLHSSERENDVRDWLKGPENKNWAVVKRGPVFIESKCWVGFNSIITKDVRLMEGTIIASGSVVTKNTKPYSVYGGNPAIFIKETD